MKKHLTYLIVLLFTASSYAQWDVFPSHVAFRLNDGTFDEWTHYTPFDISFWTDTNYNVGTTQNNTSFNVFDMNDDALLTKNTLAFTDFFGDRVRLDYNGLSLVNGASWLSYALNIQGNGGELNLYTGTNGFHVARLGSTSTNSGVGQLELWENGVQKVDLRIGSNSAGTLDLKGSNSTQNVYVGENGPNHGWIHVDDDNDIPQVSIYANSVTDRGVVDCDDLFADVKNFKVPHPEDENLNIFYACVEGPEAGAYDRGTAQLVNGEAFVPYSEHYTFIANPNTTTVQITANHWDTYGLAVIEKNGKGFRVKELKGGNGNFSFDWEIKSVRKGKEDFAVYRAKEGPIDMGPPKTSNKRKVATKNPPHDPSTVIPQHQHDASCIHSK